MRDAFLICIFRRGLECRRLSPTCIVRRGKENDTPHTGFVDETVECIFGYKSLKL